MIFNKLTFYICCVLFFSSEITALWRTPTGNTRIVGGEKADIKDFPYQLALLANEFLTCGAVIISPKFALTAGHCTIRTTPKYMYVRAGSSSYESGGQRIKVEKIHQHPNSSLWNLDFDISVLELEEELQFNENVQAVRLPKSGEIAREGADVVASGWGSLSEGGITLPKDLQWVEVQVISNKNCQEDYYNDDISDRMMCAGVDGGGKDACSGDSGGPLVGDGKLYGLVSWGLGCARPNFPGVYVSVANANLRTFVKQVTGI